MWQICKVFKCQQILCTCFTIPVVRHWQNIFRATISLEAKDIALHKINAAGGGSNSCCQIKAVANRLHPGNQTKD